jgi:hypothetical protein
LINRSDAYSILNLLSSLNETDISIETRYELSDKLSREWSYDKINNTQKGRKVKRWAQQTGKRCPSEKCGHKEFRDLNLSKIAFGHIISQNWSKAFTFLLDKIDHPDNLYLTCQSCNSSLGDGFPDKKLRGVIETIGD